MSTTTLAPCSPTSAPRPEALRSSLYVGTVTHGRPEGPRHGFRYRVAMPLLYLDELAALSAVHPLAVLDPDRRGAPRPVRLRREDFLAPAAVPLGDAVRSAVDAPFAGPIAMLAHLRTWGWLFNPLSLYYCFDATGDHVEHLVLEVTNTPWHERTVYVVGPPGEHRLAKAMHVSPFLPMDLDYRVRYGRPSEALDIAIDVVERESGRLRLATAMRLRRRPFDRAAVRRLLRGNPALVSTGIYRQAAKLARRGALFHRHPDRG